MISESIFSGRDVLVPLADVQHIEKQYEKIHDTSGLTIKYIGTDYTKLSGILVITDKTKWNFENDTWENAIWVGATANQAQEFLKAWCQYRHERTGGIEMTDLITEAERRERVAGCDGCAEWGKWENEIEYGYPSPCTKCKRRCTDNWRSPQEGRKANMY
jgi:hypothetical protein